VGTLRDSSARIREIVDAWLAGLADRSSTAARTEGLLRSYRDLGEILVRIGLEGGTKVGSGGDLLDALPAGVDRALARVTAESRRSGQSLSQVLEDVGKLPGTVVKSLLEIEGQVEPGAVLGRVESVLLPLSIVTLHLVSLLEASAARDRRERLDAFAAVMDILSHELRNRLSAALTGSEMLLSSEFEADSARRMRVAELIRSGVQEGLQTVNAMRTLAAAGPQSDAAPVRTIELSRLIRRVMDDLEPAARDAGVRIEAGDDLVRSPVDASRLRSILFNLVGNGIRYRDDREEGSYVRITTRHLQEDGRIEVCVSDNGIGIVAEEVEGLFDYRVRGGRGIVREAIEQAGGEIHAISEPGRGTTFRLIVPLAAVLEPTP
jgi:signal transduction histidine kinase